MYVKIVYIGSKMLISDIISLWNSLLKSSDSHAILTRNNRDGNIILLVLAGRFKQSLSYAVDAAVVAHILSNSVQAPEHILKAVHAINVDLGSVNGTHNFLNFNYVEKEHVKKERLSKVYI